MLTPAQSFSVIRQIEAIAASPRKQGDAVDALANALPTIFNAAVFDPSCEFAPSDTEFVWTTVEEGSAILVGLLRGNNVEEAWLLAQDEKNAPHIHFCERKSGVYHIGPDSPNTFPVHLNEKKSFDENCFDIIADGKQNATKSVSRLLRGACNATAITATYRPIQSMLLEFLVTQSGGIANHIGNTIIFAANAAAAKRIAKYTL